MVKWSHAKSPSCPPSKVNPKATILFTSYRTMRNPRRPNYHRAATMSSPFWSIGAGAWASAPGASSWPKRLFSFLCAVCPQAASSRSLALATLNELCFRRARQVRPLLSLMGKTRGIWPWLRSRSSRQTWEAPTY